MFQIFDVSLWVILGSFLVFLLIIAILFFQPSFKNWKYNHDDKLFKNSMQLSLVIPAYNEEERITKTLDETIEYFEGRKEKSKISKGSKPFDYEFVIVDDGSKDKTEQIVLQYAKKVPHIKIRVIKLPKNLGKGGAVREGMLNAYGRYMLMMDADGATDISDVEPLEKKMSEIEDCELGIVIGSRAHLVEKAKAERKWYRNIPMYVFHILVYILCVRGIKDTQCGFKLFTRKSAQAIFSNLHILRWGFDVEALFIARCLNIPIAEIAVNWTEVPGSKLNVLIASIQMARELVMIRVYYSLGLWKIKL